MYAISLQMFNLMSKHPEIREALSRIETISDESLSVVQLLWLNSYCSKCFTTVDLPCSLA